LRINFLREFFFAGTFFLPIMKKTPKNAKIRTRKNLVPRGILIFIGELTADFMHCCLQTRALPYAVIRCL